MTKNNNTQRQTETTDEKQKTKKTEKKTNKSVYMLEYRLPFARPHSIVNLTALKCWFVCVFLFWHGTQSVKKVNWLKSNRIEGTHTETHTQIQNSKQRTILHCTVLHCTGSNHISKTMAWDSSKSAIFSIIVCKCECNLCILLTFITPRYRYRCRKIQHTHITYFCHDFSFLVRCCCCCCFFFSLFYINLFCFLLLFKLIACFFLSFFIGICICTPICTL